MGWLGESQEKLLEAIEKREKAHAKSDKNREYTEEHLRKRVKAKLYRPQRLIIMSLEEEEETGPSWVVEFRWGSEDCVF